VDDGNTVLGVAYLTRSGEVRLNYVSPDARFLGVSSALIAAIEAEAMRWGLIRLTLKSTATAHHFYLERGYRDESSPETDRLKSNIYPMAKPVDYRRK
jgi:GNAT superfamily N-acetyltransferase